MKQTTEINVSLLVPGEAEAASQLVMETFRTHVAPCYTQQGVDEFAKYAKADCIQERHGHVHQTWTAKIGNVIVGVLEIRFPDHISMLFVSANHQARGIGRSLMDRAMIQLLSASPDIRELTVHSSSNAIPTYRKFGFKECGGIQEKNGIKFQPMTMVLKKDMNQFYKGLTPYYHLIYQDWEKSIRKQAKDINSIIREKLGDGVHSILDVSCGIGTQAIGLAQHGYQVTASDLSPEEAERAKVETSKKGLNINFSVSDMRDSFKHHAKQFDAVISCDNSVPHLLTDDDILLAFSQFHQCTRPGGTCIISVRDYEKEDLSKQQIKPYGVREEHGVRWLLWQVWDPHGSTYDVTMYLLEERAGSECRIHIVRTVYYAIGIQKLMDLMRSAGFENVTRRDGVFFQPLITGTRKVNIH
ncbi:MAG TPA: hypothetical protein DCZ94_13695 [Lentisphaeria bacterium]|nr:hypothetical protein [Lentisphaeria bacterium]